MEPPPVSGAQPGAESETARARLMRQALDAAYNVLDRGTEDLNQYLGGLGMAKDVAERLDRGPGNEVRHFASLLLEIGETAARYANTLLEDPATWPARKSLTTELGKLAREVGQSALDLSNSTVGHPDQASVRRPPRLIDFRRTAAESTADEVVRGAARLAGSTATLEWRPIWLANRNPGVSWNVRLCPSDVLGPDGTPIGAALVPPPRPGEDDPWVFEFSGARQRVDIGLDWSLLSQPGTYSATIQVVPLGAEAPIEVSVVVVRVVREPADTVPGPPTGGGEPVRAKPGAAG